MPNNNPYSAIDIPRSSAATRLRATSFPDSQARRQRVGRVAAHRSRSRRCAGPATEVTRLSADLAAARLWHANALAAMRATIGAQRDGEADPLYYLRDELNAPRAGLGRARGATMTSSAECAVKLARSAVAACSP